MHKIVRRLDCLDLDEEKHSEEMADITQVAHGHKQNGVSDAHYIKIVSMHDRLASIIP